MKKKHILCLFLVLMMVLSCLSAAFAAEKGSSNVTLTVEGDTGSSSGGSGSHGGSGGGGGGGGSAPKKHTDPTPVGDKAGGVDGKGNAYHLNAGVHVNENIRETGYMHGYPGMIFGMDRGLTRAEFATIMDRVFTFDETAETKTFKDCETHWAKAAIGRLAANGIVIGTSSTTFSPNEYVTKGQVLIMLSRVLDVANYAKVSNIDCLKGHYSEEALARILNSGIYTELEESFDVDEKISRAEMVHLMNNVLYVRDESAPEIEKILEDNHLFLDLLQVRNHPFYKNCIRSLDTAYLKEAM